MLQCYTLLTSCKQWRQPDTWGDTFLQRVDTAALTGSVGPNYGITVYNVCPNTRCMCIWAVSGLILMCVGLAADQLLCLLYLSSIKSQVTAYRYVSCIWAILSGPLTERLTVREQETLLSC